MCRQMLFWTLALSLFGCTQMLGTSGIPYGKPITHVQFDLGIPDVISDRSGDQERMYLPTERPEYEWPAEAPRTFYYLKHDLAVTFVLGKAVEAKPIEPALRTGILERMKRSD